MDYIPDFIDRKHGRKPIEYDIPIMEMCIRDRVTVSSFKILLNQLGAFIIFFFKFTGEFFDNLFV